MNGSDGNNVANEIRAELGKRIRRARIAAELSQEELAHAVGYTAANPISKLEAGHVASIDIVLLVYVSQACDADFSWLIQPAAEASLETLSNNM